MEVGLALSGLLVMLGMSDEPENNRNSRRTSRDV